MYFFLTCDANHEAGVNKVLFRFLDLGLKEYFEERSYGDSLFGIAVVLMCRDPDLQFKQRIRQDKKTRKLYIDIMLDADQFKLLTPAPRERIVAEKMLGELPAIIRKYKFPSFDVAAFEADLRNWMEQAVLL